MKPRTAPCKAPLTAKSVPLAPAPPLAYIAAHGALMGWARAFNWYADRPKAKGSKR
jgi:hypothetical protein